MGSDHNTFIPFANSTREDWLKVAKQEIPESSTINDLSIIKGELEIQPIYFPPEKAESSAFTLNASSNEYRGARSWVNMPRIEVNDEVSANNKSIDYLHSGADGILFELKKEQINIEKLLKDIQLDICPVSFLLENGHSSVALDFADFAAKNYSKESVNGTILWKELPAKSNDISVAFHSFTNFFPLGFQLNDQKEAALQIAEGLVNAVALIENIVGKGIAPQQVINQIGFSVAVDTDFFLEIAKLKSLRLLWQQIAGAYKANLTSLHIHAFSHPWINERYQPHGNMIKATTAAMAAILGGCDSLTIEPEDSNNTMMCRIARNVSSVIRDESHFSKIADATAGSFYLEELTTQLSVKAWKKFQLAVTE
jgi:methylmalonyl-CoA mutase